MRTSAIGALCLLLAACVPLRTVSITTPVSPAKPKPVAVGAKLELKPLDLSPDGELRLLVRLRYSDAAGRRVHVPPGGHVDVYASAGTVQWQPRARFGDPAGIVRLTQAGRVSLRVTSDLPHLPRELHAVTNTRAWQLPSVTARGLGPHAVVVGWFPRVRSGTVRVERAGIDGKIEQLAILPAPVSTVRDTSVTPGAHYTYLVIRPPADPIEVAVDVPRELPASSLDVVRGKSMWLSFDDVAHWNIDAMLDRAQSAGIRAIELRLAYGEYSLISDQRRNTIDRFIDGAAQRGIKIVGWTVPRAVHFEDLAAAVAVAAYRTPAGHGMSGLAVDLERGSDFLDVADAHALADYIARLREAVGPRVLLVATVEDPYIERPSTDAIPYAAIAAHADALQPMTYWRARAEGASLDGMRVVLTQSFRILLRRSGGKIPVVIGGQTTNLGNRWGAPPAGEIAASIAIAHGLGALGETFFDWDGTSAEQWLALERSSWMLQ